MDQPYHLKPEYKKKKSLYDKEYISRPEVKERRKEYYKKYNKKKKNILRRREYLKNRYDNDHLYKLRETIKSCLLSQLKKKNYTKNSRTYELLGCTYEELLSYLESQFKEGMSWSNHSLSGWHIDHIIPLSSAKTEEEFFKLWHYTNLQPLWAEENLKKSNKIINIKT